MAGLIAIAKSFGNPTKERQEKKKKEMVKKTLCLNTALKDRHLNPPFFFNKECTYTRYDTVFTWWQTTTSIESI